MEVLLNSKKDIKSVNTPNSMSVELNGHYRPIPNTVFSENIDRFEVYKNERDNCANLRLFYTVNPVCTNILFNPLTEIVSNEGSDDCNAAIPKVTSTSSGAYTNTTLSLPSDATPTNTGNTLIRSHLIQDTEYSHINCGRLVYHCGADIFNNHMLRANDYVSVGPVKKWDSVKKTGTDPTTLKYFNTIRDYRRNEYGTIEEEELGKMSELGNTKTKLHIYQLDNIMSFQEAYQKNLQESNGWYGFVNKTFIDIPNGVGGETINKVMNNNKPCEIYNMYPDISLFSFIPKVNKSRRRLEPNWDYCLTYPYLSDKDTFKTLNGIDKSINFTGIRLVRCVTGITTSKEIVYYFKTLINHNLSAGDYVRFYYGSSVTRTKKRTRVIAVGDKNSENKERWFCVYANDMPSVGSTITTANYWKNGSVKIWLKKETNGEECEYYFRKFKKLTKSGANYSSEIGKMAFGENIYGDRLAQIVFTDTINLTDDKGLILCDNLKRPVSEIYLTIVKRNKGASLWYSGNFRAPEVEFSHCFTNVSSGLDIGEVFENEICSGSTGYCGYNIRKQNNSGYFVEPDATMLPGEANITTAMTEFYGDIVEFDPVLFEETQLEKVYHRFNTFQREYINAYIGYDILKEDDYDLSKEDSFNVVATGETVGRQPEGYFYSPHFKTKLFDVSKTISSSLGTLIVPTAGYSVSITDANNKAEGRGRELTVTAVTDYNYMAGDIFALYSYDRKEILWGELKEATNVGGLTVLKIDMAYKNGDTWSSGTTSIDNRVLVSNKYDLILTDGTVPQYAVYVPSQETFYWRNVVPLSETRTDSDVYNTPFSNGCLYYHTNVNFFCRRQDPFNEFGLLDYDMYAYNKNPQGTPPKSSIKTMIKHYGERFVMEAIDYTIMDIINSCL